MINNNYRILFLHNNYKKMNDIDIESLENIDETYKNIEFIRKANDTKEWINQKYVFYLCVLPNCVILIYLLYLYQTNNKQQLQYSLYYIYLLYAIYFCINAIFYYRNNRHKKLV